MATGYATLRDRQVECFRALLALNAPTPPPGHAQLPTWKCLVLDRTGQDVIATSLRVQDLRDAGITLHVSVCANLARFPSTPPPVPRVARTLDCHEPTTLCAAGRDNPSCDALPAARSAASS